MRRKPRAILATPSVWVRSPGQVSASATAIFCSFVLLLAMTPPRVVLKAVSGHLVLVDMAGRTHHLAGAPHRVLLLANVMPALATLEDGTDHIIAASSLGHSGIQQGLLEKIYPGLRSIPIVGSGVRVEPEEIMRFAPDAIIGWGNTAHIARTIGFANYIALRADSTITTEFKLWALLGRLSGAAKRASIISAAAHGRLTALRKRGIDKQSRTRVLILVSGADKMWFGPKRHSLNVRLKAAGGVNIASGFLMAFFDLEELARLDPNDILISSAFSNLEPADLYAKPKWQMIRAVREHHVYVVPDFPIFTAAVFDPLLVDWLVELFHPDAPRALRRALHLAYFDVYRYSCTRSDIDELLHVQENRYSARYARFMAE